jgi:transcriptional regulator with XRE-family HTH domain
VCDRFDGLRQKGGERMEEEIGRRIRALRIAAGLSVREAADRADVPEETWSRIENGRRMARSTTLERMAAALGASMAEFGGIDDGVRADSDYVRIKTQADRVLWALWQTLAPAQQQQVVTNLAAMAAADPLGAMTPVPATAGND